MHLRRCHGVLPPFSLAQNRKRLPATEAAKLHSSLGSVFKASKKDKLEAVHWCLIRYHAECGVSNHLHDHVRMTELLNAASKLDPNSYVELKRHQFEKYLEELFISSLQTASRIIAEVRAGYETATLPGVDMKFMSVGNDGWDGEQDSLLEEV